MTSSSQTLSRSLPGLAQHDERHRSVGARLSAALAAARCQLQGHTTALCVEGHRLYLTCPECRTESPGWQLDLRAPRPRFAGAPDRFEKYAWMTGRR